MSKSVRTLAVIGIGRIGLPLALVLAESGYKVIGIDKDPLKNELLKKKKMPFMENGAQELLEKHYGRHFVLGKIKDIGKCDTVIISVGTLLGDNFQPEESDVFEVIDQVFPHLKDGSLIILRSTVHPHTTKKVSDYLAEKSEGRKIYLVYAPERIAEGFAMKELYTIPQIIGGFDETSSIKAGKIFEKFAPENIFTDPLTAELSKLILNTYRYSKFAMANELMMIIGHYGKDVYEVLDVANRNYVRGDIPMPGFAAGPCLVKDGFFLRYNTPFNTLITGAYDVNSSLPEYFLQELNKRVMRIVDKKIAFLGTAFKRNVDDDRHSLPMEMAQRMKKEGYKIFMHDPFLTKKKLSSTLKGAEVVIIAVDHDVYKKITLDRLEKLTGVNSVVCDVWNIFKTGKMFFKLG